MKILTVLFSGLLVLGQDCQPDWRNPLPEGLPMFTTTKFQDEYYVLGENGNLYTSLDFQSWTKTYIGLTNTFYDVEVLGSQMLAVGRNARTALTTDGQNWTFSTIPGPAETYQEVTEGNGLLVAVGRSGSIATSPDGLSWTLQTSGTTEDLYGLCFVENLFFAVGSNGTILSSSDGMNWNAENSGSTTFLGAVCGNSAGIIICGGNGGRVYQRQPDTSWLELPNGPSGDIRSLDFTGSRFVGHTGRAGAFESSDLTAWSNHSLAYNGDKLDFTFVDDEFLMVGYGGQRFRSFDLINWEAGFSGWPGSLWSSTTDGQSLVMVGDLGTILVSHDGFNFSPQTVSATASLRKAAHYLGQWFVVDSAGNLYSSSDAQNWSAPTNLAANLRDITYGNEWITVGSNGVILTSSDGVSWTPQSMGGTDLLMAVGYAFGKYWIANNSGDLFSSSDGVAWTPESSPTTSAIFGFRFVSTTNHFFVFGQSGAWVTTDGVVWNPTTLSSRVWDIAYDGNFYYSVRDSQWGQSSDGLNFQETFIGSAIYPRSISILDNESAYFCGQWGLVMELAGLSNLMLQWPDPKTVSDLVQRINCQ